MTQKRRRSKKEILQCLDNLCRNGKIPFAVAKEVIEASIWWETHSSGHPVRAPKHANRITGRDNSWSLTLGANTFLISAAICRCCNLIRDWINGYDEANLPDSMVKIYPKLASTLRFSVSNYDGDEYDYYSGGEAAGINDKILFGVTSICISDIIRFLEKELKLKIQVFQRPSILQETSSAKKTPISPVKFAPTKQVSPSSARKPPVSNPPASKFLTIKCPWCKVDVLPKNLEKHKRRCPKRPKNEPLPPGNRPSTITVASRLVVLRQAKSPPTKPPTVKCPWCNADMSPKNLEKHKRNCSKRL